MEAQTGHGSLRAASSSAPLGGQVEVAGTARSHGAWPVTCTIWVLSESTWEPRKALEEGWRVVLEEEV